MTITTSREPTHAAAGVGHGSLFSYAMGFAFSIILTLMAYVAVVNDLFPRTATLYAVAGLAILQLFVQLLFFLHLGSEARPRWNALALCFAVLVVVIVVFGSLWIMHNLDYNMMPQDMDRHILEEEGIRR